VSDIVYVARAEDIVYKWKKLFLQTGELGFEDELVDLIAEALRREHDH